jgi:16S rRNA (guanine527-N7)-methyltransferase
MDINKFISDVESTCNLTLDQNILTKLDLYFNLLIEENKKHNLTGITEEQDVYYKHFLDSMTINRLVSLKKETVLDLGSGPGFPGIILKLIYPNIKLFLLDNRIHKVEFLKLVVSTLKLEDVNVVYANLESKQLKINKADIITARALGSIEYILSSSLPFIRKNSLVLIQKGKLAEDYLPSVKKYNYVIHKEITLDLPLDYGFRTLISFQKH